MKVKTSYHDDIPENEVTIHLTIKGRILHAFRAIFLGKFTLSQSMIFYLASQLHGLSDDDE